MIIASKRSSSQAAAAYLLGIYTHVPRGYSRSGLGIGILMVRQAHETYPSEKIFAMTSDKPIIVL